MQFIFISENVEKITAMQMTPNKRFLATAEKIFGDPLAHISFYDLASRQLKHCIGLKPYGQIGNPSGGGGLVAGGAAVGVSQDQQSSSISQPQQAQHNTSGTPSMLLQQSVDQGQHSQYPQFLSGGGGNVGVSANSTQQQGTSGLQQAVSQMFDIVSFSFSSDSKFVACLGSDGTAVLWDWYNKNKQLGSTSLGSGGVTRITIDPKDNHSVCTSGCQHFKIWRVQ